MDRHLLDSYVNKEQMHSKAAVKIKNIVISSKVSIAYEDIRFCAVRAQGAGGQHVNKVSSAIHLRFDISASSLPMNDKLSLLHYKDARISKEGIVVIKAQRFRTQERNKEDALSRLKEIILRATLVKKTRKPTKISKASQKRRLDSKHKHAQKKNLRRKTSLF